MKALRKIKGGSAKGASILLEMEISICIDSVQAAEPKVSTRCKRIVFADGVSQVGAGDIEGLGSP